MRPFLDIDSDLNDKNGKVTLSYFTQYLLACGSGNETETANDEAESDNSDKYIQLGYLALLVYIVDQPMQGASSKKRKRSTT